jgi:hypothetical protein
MDRQLCNGRPQSLQRCVAFRTDSIQTIKSAFLIPEVAGDTIGALSGFLAAAA